MAQEFLTIKEVAVELGLRPQQISNRIVRGKIKGIKRGGIWTITRTEVNRLKRRFRGTK